MNGNKKIIKKVKFKKLVTNFNDKKDYVVNYRILKL